MAQKKKVKIDTSEELAMAVVAGMQEKKAQKIKLLNLKNVKNAIADYFVIAEAASDTQIEAVADSVEELVAKNLDQMPWQREGWGKKDWILLDYLDVVVHIFKPEKRYFYGLEELWGDAEITEIND